MLRIPSVSDPTLSAWARIVNTELSLLEPVIVGFRQDSTKIYIRCQAPLAAPWLQIHVQSSQAGEGNTSAYNATTYKSSTEVDCRATRLQDVEVTFVAGSTYVVFVIPVQYDGAGTKVLYDGVAAADRMASVGFVV